MQRLEALTCGLLDLSRLDVPVRGGAGEETVWDLRSLAQEACKPYASRAEQAGLDSAFHTSRCRCAAEPGNCGAYWRSSSKTPASSSLQGAR